jgi:hypothetical protein
LLKVKPRLWGDNNSAMGGVKIGASLWRFLGKIPATRVKSKKRWFDFTEVKAKQVSSTIYWYRNEFIQQDGCKNF